MSDNSVHTAIQSRIWQVIGMRGGLPSLSQAEVETLVEALTAGIVAAQAAAPVSALAAPPMPQPVTTEERSLWQGKPHPTAGRDAFSTQYEITTQRIKVRKGMLNRQADEAELIRVRDVRVEQSLTDRGLGIGNVTILTDDSLDGAIVLQKVQDPNGLKELIRRAVQDEQQRRGVRFGERL